jgi:hypothetical protein
MRNRWWVVALALCLGTLVAVGFAASCGGDETTPGDGGDADDGTDRVEPNPDDGIRADFVLNTMRIGTPDEGFNLDGLNTSDSDPYLPPDGAGGVDNQLGALIAALVRAGLDFDADAQIASGIADGSLLILLSHRDIDSWTNDPGLVYLYGYAGKDADDPEDPANNLTGTGRLMIDERSLEEGHRTDENASLIQFRDGILNDTLAADSNLQVGDFHAGPSLFRVDIPVQDSILTLAINGTQIVWDIDTVPTGTPALNGSIKNGLLGGYVLLADAARALSQIDLSGTTIDEATIRNILGGQADMDVLLEGFTSYSCTEATAVEDCAPGQTCESDPARGGAFYCYEQENNLDAISLGIVFTGVSCEITGIWHAPADGG